MATARPGRPGEIAFQVDEDGAGNVAGEVLRAPPVRVVERPAAVGEDVAHAPRMYGAAPLEQQHVAPDAVQLPDPLARPHDAEAATAVQRERSLVLRKDPGLERPDPRVPGARDKGFEQGSSDTAALRRRVDVHAEVGDAFVAAAVGQGAACGAVPVRCRPRTSRMFAHVEACPSL